MDADNIVAINSSSGEVVFSATTSLISQDQGNNRNEVLNGIAFDKSSGGFWITGKNWTEMYLVDFIPEASIGKKRPRCPLMEYSWLYFPSLHVSSFFI